MRPKAPQQVTEPESCILHVHVVLAGPGESLPLCSLQGFLSGRRGPVSLRWDPDLLNDLGCHCLSF